MQCAGSRLGVGSAGRRIQALQPTRPGYGGWAASKRNVRASFLKQLLRPETQPAPEPAPAPLSQSRWDYQSAVTVQQLVPAPPCPPGPCGDDVPCGVCCYEDSLCPTDMELDLGEGRGEGEGGEGGEGGRGDLDVPQLKVALERQWQRQVAAGEGEGEGGATEGVVTQVLVPLELAVAVAVGAVPVAVAAVPVAVGVVPVAVGAVPVAVGAVPVAVGLAVKQAGVDGGGWGVDGEEEEEEAPGYRTADKVAVVCVPSVTEHGRWKVMVEKSSVYNTKEDGMDSFKYAASLNEWETWSRHWQHLQGCAHLVQLQGFRKRRDTIQIYSEFCQGGDLQELLRQSDGHGLEEGVVLAIARDVLAGLCTLHTNGLVYGDLKPSNVFIGGSEEHPQYKIGDYGTMREVGRQHLHYFVSGFGYTPEYASPEILEHGTSRAGPHADLWSFGVMLHELATGSLPDVAVEFKRLHDGEFEDAAAQRRSYLRTHPSHLSMDALHPSLSPTLREVIQACMYELPGRRPQDAMGLRGFSWFAAEGEEEGGLEGGEAERARWGGGVGRGAGAGAEVCDWEPAAQGWSVCWGGELVAA